MSKSTIRGAEDGTQSEGDNKIDLLTQMLDIIEPHIGRVKQQLSAAHDGDTQRILSLLAGHVATKESEVLELRKLINSIPTVVAIAAHVYASNLRQIEEDLGVLDAMLPAIKDRVSVTGANSRT